MTIDAQIEQQLQDEFDKFLNDTYKGEISIPSNIIELFKKAVMSLAPQFHRINAYKIKVLAHKLPKELTHGDIKDLITIIVNCPLEKCYEDFDEAINSHIRIEKFILSYNNHCEEFKEKLQMKKVTLQSLSGARGNSNNMRIIN